MSLDRVASGAERTQLDLSQATTREPDFPGASRASLGIYNVPEDVERFLDAMGTIARKAWAGRYTWSAGEWRSPPVSGTPAERVDQVA